MRWLLLAAAIATEVTASLSLKAAIDHAALYVVVVVGYVASSADGAKDKVFEIVARETREFLSNLNLTEEIAKILTTLSFEIKTEIRFIPNSERYGGVEPDVKAGVKLKRQERPPDQDEREGIGSRIANRLFRRGDSDREGDRDRGDDEDDPLDKDS